MINFYKSRESVAEKCEKSETFNQSVRNGTALISETLSIVENENLIVALGQGKLPLNVFSEQYCEKLACLHLFPFGKFCC